MTSERFAPRDTSRAHWQRGAGMILFSGMADQVYAEARKGLADEDLFAAIILNMQQPERTEAYEKQFDVTPAWAMAYKIGEHYIYPTEDWFRPPQRALRDDLARYTYFGELEGALREGMLALIFFGLNIGRLIEHRARERSVPGFEATNLGDISKLLSRSDFKEFIEASSNARNGEQADYTATIVPTSTLLANNDRHEVVFAHGQAVPRIGGQVVLGEQTRKRLRASLRNANRESRIREDIDVEHIPVSMQSSSGCMARHMEPMINNKACDTERLGNLAEYFRTTEAELTKKRPQSAIADGLDCMAELFEAAHQVSARHISQ